MELVLKFGGKHKSWTIDFIFVLIYLLFLLGLYSFQNCFIWDFVSYICGIIPTNPGIKIEKNWGKVSIYNFTRSLFVFLLESGEKGIFWAIGLSLISYICWFMCYKCTFYYLMSCFCCMILFRYFFGTEGSNLHYLSYSCFILWAWKCYK